jgi:hypothetical protein
MQTGGGYSGRDWILIVLMIGSLAMIGGSIYITKTLSIAYGMGVGSLIENVSYGVPISSVVLPEAVSLSALHTGIVESYVVSVVAVILAGASLIMFVRRNDGPRDSSRTYGMLHSAFTFVYLLLVFVIVSNFYSMLLGFQNGYMLLPYGGIVLCIVCDGMMQYQQRFGPQPQKMKYSIGLDPSKPFSNVMNMQDELFSKMSGHIRIIDKHFNSSSLDNFHRLLGGSLSNFTKITILTSNEMMDTSFMTGINDLRKELSGASVGLDIRVMDDKDAVEQHERILLDDKVAYKIPPFNIINKRSEHITRIGFNEAQRRFHQLYSRSLKPENYFLKKAHEGGGEPPKQ